MARIKYSALVTSINGSSGGSTFQKNLYGDTFKNKSHMVTPRTPYQNQSKILLAACVSRWRTMTGTARQSWADYVSAYPYPTRLNPDAYLNAFNYFTKFNCLRLLAEQAVIETVSLTQYDNSIDTITLEWDGAEFYFGFSITAYSNNHNVLIFISPKIQGYTNPRTNKTRFIKQFSTASGVYATEIGTFYEARMGSPLEIGAQYYIDVTWINQASGQIVEWPTSVIEVTS